MAVSAETTARRALLMAWFCGPLPIAIWWLTTRLPIGVWTEFVMSWCRSLAVFGLFGQLAAPVAFLVALLHWPAVIRTAAGRVLLSYFLLQSSVLAVGIVNWLGLFVPERATSSALFRTYLWALSVLAVAFPIARCWPATRHCELARKNPTPVPSQDP